MKRLDVDGREIWADAMWEQQIQVQDEVRYLGILFNPQLALEKIARSTLFE